MKHSGWYPDYLFRVFRPEAMEVHVSGAHYSFHPLGPTRKLKGDIIHYPYRNFREHLDKVNSYAQQGADDAKAKAKGRRGGVAAGVINAVHGAFYAFLKYVRAAETGDWGPKQ